MKACPFPYETLSSYVDGEVSLDAESSLRRHLDICPSCRRKVEALLTLKAIVAGATEVRPVPHTLRERLSAIEPGAAAWTRLPAALAAIAACAILVVAASFWWTGRQGHTDSAISTLVADHIHFLQVKTPLEISAADPQSITNWFSDKVDFPVNPPRFRNATLLGARLCSLWGHKVALAFYEARGKRLSLFVMSKSSLPSGSGGRAECHRAMGGYEVCFQPTDDAILAVVAERNQMKLLLPDLQVLDSTG